MRAWVVTTIATIAVSCAPNPSAPVSIMAMLYDQTNTLGPQQTTLSTIQSISSMSGSVATLYGGAEILLDPMNAQQQMPTGLSPDQLASAFYASRGGAVTADLIAKGPVLWPADFHSWNMTTLYWNFEQAWLYFQKVYLTDPSFDLLQDATVLYWADYKDLSITDPTLQDATDNAFFYSPLDAFVIVPFSNDSCTSGSLDETQEPGCLVPIAMNTGIIGHEYSHRVFNYKAGGQAPYPVYLDSSWSGTPLNLVKSMDEGFADFHGYGVTCSSAANNGPGCNTRFLAPSFGTAQVVTDRDFSLLDKCMTVELRTEITTQSTDEFVAQGNQYKLGTIFATSLYQAANKSGKLEIMQEALVAAYDDSTPATPGFNQIFEANDAMPENITLEMLSDVILSHITDPALATQVCNELWERLDLQVPDDGSVVPSAHCPTTSLRGSVNCQPLPTP